MTPPSEELSLAYRDARERSRSDSVYRSRGGESLLAVAPMMDWTDRHCRYFHRVLSRRALLYTEMVVADAIMHGDRDLLLGHAEFERPLALQIGGSEPEKLARAVELAQGYGFDEINLNVGCPSDRVQSGAFGACLMKTPELVGDCVAAMKSRASVPVTVKCRLGVDDQDTGPALDRLAEAVWSSGADALWVHARKAWLDGLSPAQNRDVPPLDYGRVRRLKTENPQQFVGLNGGLASAAEARLEVLRGDTPLDGAMIGRAAYRTPEVLRLADHEFFDDERIADWEEIIDEMAAYCARHIAGGGRLHHVTRHMTGLFQGMPGARRWRQILSTEAAGRNAGISVLRRAFAAVDLPGESRAA